MHTKILQSWQIEEAVTLLKNSQLVALPTETVYGLAADAKDERAIHKIFTAKGRPSDHPLIVHIEHINHIYDWVDDISENAKKLAKHFWPGPLTMIFHKKKSTSNLITGGLDTIALRVPNNLITLEIIKKLGHGIAAPSANFHKKTSPTKLEHVLKTLNGRIAAVIDGGPSSIGIESTILDMTKEVPIILRPGSISAQMIENALKIKIKSFDKHSEKVSGNMEIHYQPEKPLYLVSKSEIENILKKKMNAGIVFHSNILHFSSDNIYKMPSDKSEYTKSLYSILHQMDSKEIDSIFVEKPPLVSDWNDVNDRLQKASQKYVNFNMFIEQEKFNN